MPISLSMVASRAGTSKAAVSRAFSGSSEISEETRQRIFKIAAELGYIHNASRSQHARLIRSQNDSSVPPAERTNLVTLLFYKTNRAHVYNVPYYQELIGQLDKTFRSEGMNIIEAYPQNEKEYSRIMKTASTDALILLSNIEYLTDEFISLLRLYAAHKPLVFLSNYIGKYKNEFHSVRADDFGVGTNGAEYCCENNNGEVVFVDSGLGMAVVEDRFLGYKTVMYRENRQTYRIIFNVEKWQLYKVSELKGQLKFPEGKITFQCASDSTLFAFVEFLKEENLFDALRMRFVGMDGIPEIKKEDIRDASVQVDLESMARETLHLVNDVLDGKINEPKSLLVGSRLLLKKD